MSDRVAHRVRAGLIAGLLVAAAVGCARDTVVAPYRGSLDELATTYDLVTEAGAARALQETRRIDLGSAQSRSQLVAGWGEPEVDPSTGETFVWAIATEASLEVVLLRSGPATLRFRCRPFAFEGAPNQHVDVVVNGVAAGGVDLDPTGGSYGVELPRHALRPGRNLITLRFAWAEKPIGHVEGSEDTRTLAAAFDEIRIGAEQPSPIGHGAPISEPGALVLSPGCGLVYTVVPDGDVVLDLGLAGGGGERNLMVWIGPPGGEASMLDPSGAGSRPVAIQWPPGSPLAIGFAVAGGENSGRDVALRPRLLGASVRTASNLLLIVMDTLRADFVGAYGGSATTPAIDGLAARGTVFERAYSHIAITGPSHASLFTALLPFEHGVHNNARILDASAGTLAESLEQRGWTTAAVVSLGVLKREFGFAQGFDVYRDDFGDDWMKDAGQVTSETVPLLSDALVEPYFLWVHYSDPHEPYTPPDLDYPWVDLTLDGRPAGAISANGRSWTVPLTVAPGTHHLRFVARRPERDPGRWYRLDAVRLDGDGTVALSGGDWEVLDHPGSPPTYQAQLPAALTLGNDSSQARTVALQVNFKQRLDIPEVRVRYAQEVEYADRQIGALLEAMRVRGLLDNTLVVFASDHGEGLGYHNHVGHIHQVYDTLIKVPLILAYPGVVPAGLRVPDLVGLVDVLPTVAELLGVAGPSTASGASLVPLLQGVPMTPRAVIAQTYRPEAFTDKQAMLVGGFKYIHSWSPEREWEELYDLDGDPDELNDVIDSRPEVAARLRAALAERLAATPEGSAVAAELSDADRDRLRALGYVH